MRADRDPIIAKLRRLKGAKYIAHLVDSTSKTLVLSTKANKWEELQRTLQSLQWMTVEAVDADGGVLGVVESDIDYEEEDMDPVVASTTAIVKIITGAIGQAMQETRRMFADSMSANSKLVEGVLTSVHTMQESYQLALQVQRTALISGATPGADGGDFDGAKIMEMMKLAAMFMNKQPPQIAVEVKPGPPKPRPQTNGKTS